MRLAAVAAVALTAGCATTRVWHGLSPDRSLAVEVLEQNESQWLRADGHDGPGFDAVPAQAIAFAERGKALAYAGQQGRHWVVVTRAGLSPPHDGIGPIAFSADGAHLAWAALDGARWQVIHDDLPGPRFDSLFANALVFSPDGKRLAYVGEAAGKAQVVVDGELGPAFDAVAELSFSSDGAQVGYVARGKASAWVVVDGRPGPPHQKIRGLRLGRGGHHAYVALTEGRRAAVIDGIEREPHDAVEPPIFSPDGTRVAYLARDGAAQAVVLDGVAGETWDAIEPASLGFSPDGSHLAFIAHRGAGAVVVRDGKAEPAHERVTGVVQGANGRWGYLAFDGDKAAAVIDSVPLLAETWVGDLVLASDGKRYAYLARRGAKFALVHDAGSLPVDVAVDGSVAFSADGKRCAVLAGEAAGKRLFIAIEDGREGPFDSDELAGVAADRPQAKTDLIRRWVAAEADLAGLPPVPEAPPALLP